MDDNAPLEQRRILYIITDLDVGGAEKALTDLATRLDPKHWSPAVCCLLPAGPMAERLEAAGIPVTSLNMKSAWSLGWKLIRLRRLIRSIGPDIVHTYLFHASLIGRLASIRNGVSVVVSSIRVAERRYRHHLLLDRLTSSIADQLICVSQGVAHFTREVAGLPNAKLCVISNGIELPQLAELSPSARESLGLSNDSFVLLFVGRLEHQKGVDCLLVAVQQAIQSEQDIQLLIVGAGPEREGLQALSVQLGLEHRVRFLGFRNDVAELMRLSDVLVLPSRWEGMPNVILEAMASNLPVLATRTEGTVELIQDQETGYLVDIDDFKTLADAIVAMKRAPEKIALMSENARRQIEKKYSIQGVVDQHVALYERLLAKRSQ